MCIFSGEMYSFTYVYVNVCIYVYMFVCVLMSTKSPLQTNTDTLQHTATHCNTLQHTATHCNTLQHTATHCNTLQHTATNEYRHTHCMITYSTMGWLCLVGSLKYRSLLQNIVTFIGLFCIRDLRILLWGGFC